MQGQRVLCVTIRLYHDFNVPVERPRKRTMPPLLDNPFPEGKDGRNMAPLPCFAEPAIVGS
jgi:hypothetical protein